MIDEVLVIQTSGLPLFHYSSDKENIRTRNFFVGEISNEDLRKRDFRKALQITNLSMISSVIISILVYLINFGI
jgi:hypothetical protein